MSDFKLQDVTKIARRILEKHYPFLKKTRLKED